MKKFLALMVSVSLGTMVNGILEPILPNVWIARGIGALTSVLVIYLFYKYLLRVEY